MARPLKLDRPQRVQINLPESVYEPLALLLFSPAEGRVPHGAWSEFFTTLARQALAKAQTLPKE
jgi:hypothetical protein